MAGTKPGGNRNRSSDAKDSRNSTPPGSEEQRRDRDANSPRQNDRDDETRGTPSGKRSDEAGFEINRDA